MPDPTKRSREVTATLRALKQGQQDNNGGIRTESPQLFRVRAHPDALERVGTFLDLLLTAGKDRGFGLVETRKGLGFAVKGEHLPFELYQVIKRKRHVATETEEARMARWNRRHARNFDIDAWDSRPTIPLWDFVPSGEMKLEVGSYPRPQTCTHVFTDSRSRRIEGRIAEMLDSFEAHAEYLKASRIQEELQRQAGDRRRLELERERVEAAHEQERRAYLDSKLEALRRRNELKLFVGRLSAEADGLEPCAFVDWAAKELARLEDELSLSRIIDETAKLAAFERLVAAR